MNIGISAFYAAFVSALGNSLSGRLIAAIEFHFIKHFLGRRKKLRLLAFRKEFLMLVGPIRQKHAAAGGDFEAARSVLVRTNFA
jgi:hypothetical protein